MSEHELTIKCYPTQEIYKSGGPVRLRVELINTTKNKLDILAAGVPWTFQHAIKFTLADVTRKNVTFENRLWVIEPPSVPDLTIESGKAASGAVDLARYLYTPDDRSIGDVPGTYIVQAHLLTFISLKGRGEKFKKIEIDSEPFTVVIGK